VEQFIQLTCQRCGHTWVPNVPSPIVCAKCHSPYWRLPRRNGRPPGHKVIQNTVHTEPLVTQTPQVQTPIYSPPPPAYIPVNPPTFMGSPVVRTYPPPGEGLQGIDYGQPPHMYQEPPEPPIRFPSAPEYTEIERAPFIDADKLMPHPLRKCKHCGYKGYGDNFRNHSCRR
jgi:hypothetical protein